MLPVCYSYASVCYLYVSVCYPYVTRMYSYVPVCIPYVKYPCGVLVNPCYLALYIHTYILYWLVPAGLFRVNFTLQNYKPST